MYKKLAAFIGVVGLMVGLSGCGINTIPTKEAAAKQAWADVQVQYQRRADLVPQLVATVKGNAAFESQTLKDVIAARAAATQVSVDASTITDPNKFKQFQQAQSGLSSALGRLMVIQEQYPTLRANEAFQTLMSQLEGTANRVEIAQRDYNAAATAYNLSLKTFPTVIYASTFQSSYKPMELFTATAGAEKAPEVNFDSAKPASAAAQ